MFYEIKDESVVLSIKAQPSASKNEFCGMYNHDAVKIRIKAPAVEGAANRELVAFLSKSFKLPKSDFVIVSGENSKIKRVKMPLSQNFLQFIKDIENL